MTRKEAMRKLFMARDAIEMGKNEETVNKAFECACYYQSNLFPAQCNSRDCRYCYLERMKNQRLHQLRDQKVSINVTININIEGESE